ncbi:MAG TPA: M23 family metallopeptidase, partial [Bacteroidetes bacterium]|nr:M23 family metallopeptidase [Bacteroidota bacterium]
YAVRDGYIYRIKVSPYGFGQAIYLRHEDGQFSVYGHMSKFSPEIEEFLYQKQYASKQYEQEIYLPEHQMPVRKGKLIGYSGNSGSSHGPHLHFEIREADERITNPLKHYRNLIQDNVKPIVQTIGIQALELGSRVNGQFEKLEIVPEGSQGNYRVPGIIGVTGKIGFEYHGYDLLNGAGNHCGINYTRLFLDNELIFEFNMDRFSFEEKKFINVHFDYGHYKREGKKFQKCYLDNGNKLEAYQGLVDGGVINLWDNAVHQVRIELGDTYHNTSVIRAQIRRDAKRPYLPGSLSFPGATTMHGLARRNVYVVKVKNPSTAHLRGLDLHYADGETERVLPAYFKDKKLVFLVNLNKWKHPERIVDPVTGKQLDFHLRQTVLPEKNNIVEYGELQTYFPYTAVFDTLPLRIQRKTGNNNMYSDIYEIGSQEVPLLKAFVLNFEPKHSGNPQHLIIAKKSRAGTWRFLGNEIKEDGGIYASSSTFGTFCVMADSSSPRIKPLNFSDGSTIPGSQTSLRLKVTDNFSGIQNQKILCTLDGRWVLFSFDAKTSSIRHRFRTRPGPGQHRLEVMVYDNANNLAKKTFNLYF